MRARNFSAKEESHTIVKKREKYANAKEDDTFYAEFGFLPPLFFFLSIVELFLLVYSSASNSFYFTFAFYIFKMKIFHKICCISVSCSVLFVNNER